MADQTPQDRARDAIYERIAEKAAEASWPELVQLGEAFAQVTYGAQGRYLADYHHTEHGGEPRARPAPGFEARDPGVQGG